MLPFRTLLYIKFFTSGYETRLKIEQDDKKAIFLHTRTNNKVTALQTTDTMLLDVIVITAPIWAHKKISKYFYGGDEEHNLQYWKRHFLDDEMEVTWNVMDKSAGVAFIEVETDGTAPPVAIIKTLVDKLEEAVKFVLNKHDIPVDIMYRHSGMRYEMSFT